MTYEQAIQVDGVSGERRRRLLDYVTRLNEQSERPLEARTVRCAGLLLRSDRAGHVAIPTAIAQAQSLGAFAGVGEPVRELLGACLQLEAGPLEQCSVSRTTLRRVLHEIGHDLIALAASLNPDGNGR